MLNTTRRNWYDKILISFEGSRNPTDKLYIFSFTEYHIFFMSFEKDVEVNEYHHETNPHCKKSPCKNTLK